MTKKLELFLTRMPVFQALFRTTELEAIRAEDFKEPIFDLGCGDGLFSLMAVGKGKNLVGLDLDKQALVNAKKEKELYRLLVLGDGQRLPFADTCFATIIANSSLEHIKNLEPVLKEIYRILQKKGRLIISAPSERRAGLYAATQILNRLGLSALAKRFGVWENKFFAHYHCWSGKSWQKKLKKLGFFKSTYQYKGSPFFCFLNDLFLPFALSAFLEKKLLGHYLNWRKYTAPALAALLKPVKDKVVQENGAVVIIEAIK